MSAAFLAGLTFISSAFAVLPAAIFSTVAAIEANDQNKAECIRLHRGALQLQVAPKLSWRRKPGGDQAHYCLRSQQ